MDDVEKMAKKTKKQASALKPLFTKQLRSPASAQVLALLSAAACCGCCCLGVGEGCHAGMNAVVQLRCSPPVYPQRPPTHITFNMLTRSPTTAAPPSRTSSA